jgi:hypothetical protein
MLYFSVGGAGAGVGLLHTVGIGQPTGQRGNDYDLINNVGVLAVGDILSFSEALVGHNFSLERSGKL